MQFESVIFAMRGAAAVFLNSRALGPALEATVAAARDAGIRRLVALSAINADDDVSRQPSRFRGDRNAEVEQLAVDSGLEWVSLRPTVFASNFVGMWAPQIPLTGPQAFTNSELVDVIGAVLGQDLRYVEAPEALVRKRFQDIGLSAEFVWPIWHSWPRRSTGPRW